MKKIISLFLLLFLISCNKKVEKIKTPTFIFTYQDAKSNYSLRYLGKDTLYLNDIKLNKNYYSSIHSVLGNELSRTINAIDKPEYMSSYESKNSNDAAFRFLILNAKNIPNSSAQNSNAEKEVYKAAQKMNEIKNDLNFVTTDKGR